MTTDIPAEPNSIKPVSIEPSLSGIDIDAFARRYAAVWNEPDPQARRSEVRALWAESGYEQTESAQHRGHHELEERVLEAYEEFVAGGQFEFVYAGDAAAHHDTITFRVHMVPRSGGPIVWTGSIVVELDASGRIWRDRQFALPSSPVRPVVEEFLRRLGGDPQRIAELFANTVDWRLDWPSAGHPAVPWIRPRATRADVAEHFSALRAHHVPELASAKLATVLVDGTDAVVLGEVTQTVRATGTRYSFDCALHLSVTNGLITRYHVYEDSLTVAEALSANRDDRA